MSTAGKGIGTRDAVLNVLLGGYGGVGIYKPPTVYVGLFTSIPNESGGTEASVGRVAVQNDGTRWAFTSPDKMKNVSTISLPVATQPGYTAYGFGIWNASSGGALLYFGPVTPVTIAPGNNAIFTAGALVVTED
jgi:hypothetical protein